MYLKVLTKVAAIKLAATTPKGGRSVDRSLFFGLVSVVSLLGALPMRAEPLYDNGPPDQTNGFEMTHWIEADDFTLGTDARLENVKFWNAEGSGSFEGSIVWQIYSNGPGDTVGTLLTTGTSTNLTHVATGLDLFGYPEFITTFDITPVFVAGRDLLASPP